MHLLLPWQRSLSVFPIPSFLPIIISSTIKCHILPSSFFSIYSTFSTLLMVFLLVILTWRKSNFRWGKWLQIGLEESGSKEWWKGCEEKKPQHLFSQKGLPNLRKPLRSNTKTLYTLLPQPVWLSGKSTGQQTEGSQVQFFFFF